VRRVIALIAAALLALTIAGPVAADPIDKSQFPNVYEIDCTEIGGSVTYQNAHGVPGWDTSWAPGDTPWLLLGYTYNYVGGAIVVPAPRGLDRDGKLYGPCTIDKVYPAGATWNITDAYFLRG